MGVGRSMVGGDAVEMKWKFEWMGEGGEAARWRGGWGAFAGRDGGGKWAGEADGWVEGCKERMVRREARKGRRGRGGGMARTNECVTMRNRCWWTVNTGKDVASD